ncbi:murein hydrolase activator EnvC family protein [Paracoccus niistensis]|uniref:Murein hydrolase activator EnvC family protein n=1 Tax=Paracoccus niistensis TaxID=632935 RepID=A0ABV6I4I9_9RHOB
MTPGRDDEDGQMVISVTARAGTRAGFGRNAGQVAACGLVLVLAGCVQPGAAPGAPGQPGSAAAPGQVAAAGQPAAGGAGTVSMGPFRIPQIRWPLGAGAGAGPAQGGAAGATPQVTDPFAGQGVRKPSVADATPARAATPAASSQTTAAVVTAPGVGSPTPRPPSSGQPLPREETKPASAPTKTADAPNLGSTRTAASGSGKFAMPANGSIMRAYKKGTNEGIDISAPPGSPVKAAGGGTVAAVTRDTDGVPIVVVRHDDGLMTVYAGVDKLSVAKGDAVKRGQSIGAARSSGVLHFEVRDGFDSVDPEGYL